MLHITSTKYGEAVWHIAHRQIWMESFTDWREPGPAYRLRMDGSTVEIPNGRRGVVYFGEAEQRPDLPFVEDNFPGHRDLWLAVEVAYWDVVEPLDHLRVDDLSPVVSALDYTTGEWAINEIREIVDTARAVA
ncbi:hypothetical protein ACQPW1_10840 [Nocardia sp. CA-128927]|uniref:hypothetical protein n=1 Tax=Nocardia sp. CA-128927 TaxID=3239975 RepID=UPI003D96FBA6